MSMTAEELRGQMNGMFAEKGTGKLGYDYAMDVLKAEGASPAAATTALMVFSNSLLSHLARSTEENDKRLKLALDCLINTAERTTEFDNVYDDVLGQHISWEEVKEIRQDLGE